MAYLLSSLQEKIITHPYFQETKGIIENNACHKRESVYDHLLVTAKRAEKMTNGDFISNKNAKDAFVLWMETEVVGMKQRDLAIIAALTHDIGKILSFRETGKVSSINRVQKDKTTLSLGHEYWGSTIAEKLLRDCGLDNNQTAYITRIIRLHGSLTFVTYDKEKSLHELIGDIKAQAEGLYKEVLFNTYIDVFTCEMFQEWIQVIEKMFHEPIFYEPREYFIENSDETYP